VRAASVVKLVDAPDSKSGSERSAGSIPARGTKEIRAKSPALIGWAFCFLGIAGTSSVPRGTPYQRC
jgi:hypothetical protein